MLFPLPKVLGHDWKYIKRNSACGKNSAKWRQASVDTSKRRDAQRTRGVVTRGTCQYLVVRVADVTCISRGRELFFVCETQTGIS